MKTVEELNKQLGKITEKDKQKIDSIILILQDISKKEEITEDNIEKIISSAELLNSLGWNFTSRLIRILKQNHIIS